MNDLPLKKIKIANSGGKYRSVENSPMKMQKLTVSDFKPQRAKIKVDNYLEKVKNVSLPVKKHILHPQLLNLQSFQILPNL